MSASESSPKAQWEIRDELQKVSGPYTTTQLLEFASNGLIPKTSEVRHPQQTNGQWVGVMKIAKLASSIDAAFKKPVDPFAALNASVASNAKSIVASESTTSDRTSPSRYRFQSSTSPLDFFDWTMTRYLTPVLVQVVWALCLVFSFLGLAMTIVSFVYAMFQSSKPTDPPMWFAGPFAIVFSIICNIAFLVVARVALEGIMVVFNNAKLLSEIRDRVEH